MRFIVIFFLSALIFCSCRSHKQVQCEVSETSRTLAQFQYERDSTSRIIELLRSASSVELSGIHIEFFLPQPDSMHPDIRAVPKSISIDKANISESADIAKLASADVVETETENLQSDASLGKREKIAATNNSLSWRIWLIFIPCLILLTLCLLRNFNPRKLF